MRQWRLDTVRRLRGLAERQSRIKLAQSIAEEKVAGSEVERRRSALESRSAPMGRLDAARLRALHLQGVRSAELLEEAAEVYLAAQETAALDRLGWTQAAAEAEAVDRVTERRRREAAELANRVSADTLDDLVGMLRVLRERR